MKAGSSYLAVLCLAASLVAVRGQVGYVSVGITNGYNFLGNPFNASDTNGAVNNSITNVLASGNAAPAIPAGTAVYVWNTGNQSFGTASTYSSSIGWSINYDLSPGKGFVLYSPSSWTLILVGGVISGSSTNILPGTNRLALVASRLPLQGDFSASGLGLPTSDGENVFLFRSNVQTLSDAFTWFTNYGWFDPSAVSGTNGPTIAIAQSFFVQHPGPDLSWVQTYSPSASSAAGTIALVPNTARLSSLHINGGTVVLTVANAGGMTYSINFSADGQTWTKLATNQTQTTWTGPFRGGRGGYYRGSNP